MYTSRFPSIGYYKPASMLFLIQLKISIALLMVERFCFPPGSTPTFYVCSVIGRDSKLMYPPVTTELSLPINTSFLNQHGYIGYPFIGRPLDRGIPKTEVPYL